jgi:hypothetical protein
MMTMAQNLNKGLISDDQDNIFHARWDGMSCAAIRQRYRFCNDEAITRCLIRMVLGFFWIWTYAGRRLLYAISTSNSFLKLPVIAPGQSAV